MVPRSSRAPRPLRYSGWHDPYIGWHEGGEFKGVRPTYGAVTNDAELLLGARRPHQPMNFTLRPGEVRTRRLRGEGPRVYERGWGRARAWFVPRVACLVRVRGAC